MLLKRFLIVIAIIVIPPVLLWLYLPGWTHYSELRKEDERLKKELSELKQRNRDLERQEFLLRNDVRYLEKVLREELNVVRPDETVYKLVPEAKEPPRSAGSGANSSVTVSGTVSSSAPLAKKRR